LVAFHCHLDTISASFTLARPSPVLHRQMSKEPLHNASCPLHNIERNLAPVLNPLSAGNGRLLWTLQKERNAKQSQFEFTILTLSSRPKNHLILLEICSFQT
jgi:hypothetical protein